MRLTEEETKYIVDCTASYLKGAGTLYLYGSRVDDGKSGGDIDLLLVVPKDVSRDELLDQKHLLLRDIKEAIGDQRIDFAIVTEKQKKSDPFVRLQSAQAIVLAQWTGLT